MMSALPLFALLEFFKNVHFYILLCSVHSFVFYGTNVHKTWLRELRNCIANDCHLSFCRATWNADAV